MMVFDPSGTPAYGEQYSAPIEVKDLTNNASDHVFGVAINNNSTNIAVHGVETFFSDSSLRLQGKFATFNSGAGVAFHPGNVDEETADLDRSRGVRCLGRLLDPDRRQLQLPPARSHSDSQQPVWCAARGHPDAGRAERRIRRSS